MKNLNTNNAQLIFDLTTTDLDISTDVYFYIVGLVGTDYYYLDSNFTPTLMSESDNTEKVGSFPGMKKYATAIQNALAVNYPLKWANWGIKVAVGSNLILNLGNINTTTIPNLGTGTSAFSGRIYVSVGVPQLPFTVQLDKNKNVKGYTAPVFGDGSGVGGSLTLFDWIEFSYDKNGNFDGNTTQVNQFGFPLFLSGINTNGNVSPTQGKLNTSRSKILSELVTEVQSPFGGSDIIVEVPSKAKSLYPKNVSYLRAISPLEASKTTKAVASKLNSYFNSDIDLAYKNWQSKPITVTDVSTGTYTGVVFPLAKHPDISIPNGYPESSLAFYKGKFTMAELVKKLKTTNPIVPAFYLTGTSNKITSNDIFQCADSLATGGTAQKNVGKILGAAFNRGLIVSASKEVTNNLSDKDCTSSSCDFYKSGTTFNTWADLFHEFSENGLAYGFPYDDVCDQNSSIPTNGNTLQASFVRIELGKSYS